METQTAEKENGVIERVHALEVAQATQAATQAGAAATTAAAQAGTASTAAAGQAGTVGMMIAGSAGLVVGMFLGLAMVSAARSGSHH